MRKPWQITEAAFDERLRAAFGKHVHIHAFTDAAKVRGFMKGVSGGTVVKGTSLPQPADRLVTVKGVTFYCDVKHCEDPVSFSFSGIQPAQWSAGKQVTIAGGRYCFAIYAKARDEWFLVPYQIINTHARKSIRWDELANFKWSQPHELP